MDIFKKMFPTAKDDVIGKDEIAKLLGTNKEAFEAFEKAYTNCVLDKPADKNDLFRLNSRQASGLTSRKSDNPEDIPSDEEKFPLRNFAIPMITMLVVLLGCAFWEGNVIENGVVGAFRNCTITLDIICGLTAAGLSSVVVARWSGVGRQLVFARSSAGPTAGRSVLSVD